MSKKKAALPNATEKPRVHKDLAGFDIKINSFDKTKFFALDCG